DHFSLVKNLDEAVAAPMFQTVAAIFHQAIIGEAALHTTRWTCHGLGTASLASADRAPSLPRKSTAETEYKYLVPGATLLSRNAGALTTSELRRCASEPSLLR